MCEIKSKIDESDNSKLWDKAKRRVNPYELVNVLGTNILQNEKISKHENYVPLSRAFFKLTEIFLSIDIVPDKYKSTPGVIANIAEGPGGFIEALYKQRTVVGLQDTFYGITLQPKNRNIPGWEQLQRRKKHFLNNKNVILKTGNLYNVKSVLKYSKLFTKQKAWLVTCDGGFDYSNDFNNQEKNSRKIIYAEITTTLLIQEKNGSMVCKMFDLFTKFSLQIIYLLTLLYEQVYIVKPLTSRPANSEKYIVATRFKGIQPELSQSMINCLLNWDDINTKKVDNYLKTSIFYPLSNTITDDVKKIVGGLEIENMNLPDNFTERIKTINIFVTNNQKMYITKTLKYIKNFKNTVSDKKFQKKYSELWFNKYNVLNKDKMFKCC
jgi:23S rRNA U2552 (ribose-2'-O)-methylase RlmE/FtsJ